VVFDETYYVTNFQNQAFRTLAERMAPFTDRLPTQVNDAMMGLVNGDVFSFDAIDIISTSIANNPQLTKDMFGIQVESTYNRVPVQMNPMGQHAAAMSGAPVTQPRPEKSMIEDRKAQISKMLTNAMYDGVATDMLASLTPEQRQDQQYLTQLEQEAYDTHRLMLDLSGEGRIGNKPILQYDGIFTSFPHKFPVPRFSGYLADMFQAGGIDLVNAFAQFFEPASSVAERRERAEKLRETTLQFDDQWDDASWENKTLMTLGRMAEGTPMFMTTAPLQIYTGGSMAGFGFGTSSIIGVMALESTTVVTLQEMARLRENPEWNIYTDDKGIEYSYEDVIMRTGGDPEKMLEYSVRSNNAAKWGYLSSVATTNFAVDGLTSAMFMTGLRGLGTHTMAGAQYKEWWKYHLANNGIATTTAAAGSGVAAMQQYIAQQQALGREVSWAELEQIGEQASLTGAGMGFTMSTAGSAYNSMVGSIALSKDRFGRARMNMTYLKRQEEILRAMEGETNPQVQQQLRSEMMTLWDMNLKRQLNDQEFYRSMNPEDRHNLIDISNEANILQRQMNMVGEDSPLYEGYKNKLTDLLKRRENIESLYEADPRPLRYDDDGNLLSRDPFAEGAEIPQSEADYAANKPAYGATTPLRPRPLTPIRQDMEKHLGYDRYEYYESLVDRYHSLIILQEDIMKGQQQTVKGRKGDAVLGDRPFLQADVEAQLRLMDSKGFDAVSTLLDKYVYGKDGVAQILTGKTPGVLGKGKDLLAGNNSSKKIIDANAEALGKVMPQVEGQTVPMTPLSVFNQFLYAMHAPERNAHIYAKNKAEYDALAKLEDPTFKQKERMKELTRFMDERKGSGMSDEQAQAFLDALPPELRSTFDAANEKVRLILKDTQENMLKYGFISQERFNQLQSNFEHYVPLFGKSIGDNMMINPETGEVTVNDAAYSRVPGKNQALDNKFLREAKGRSDETGDVFAKLLMQNMETTVLGERNVAMQRLHTLLSENPSDLYRIVDQGQQNAENTQVVFIDGERKYIEFFNRDGSPDNYMLQGLKKAGMDFSGRAFVDNLYSLMNHMSEIRKVHVNYNPLFGPGMFIPDSQTAVANAVFLTENQFGYGLRTEDGRPIDSGAYARSVGDPTALMKSWGVVARTEMLGLSDVPFYAEYKAMGGQTGWTMLMPLKELAAKLERVTDPTKRDQVTANWGVNNYARLVESWNATWENAVRFNAYRKAREHGMSKDMAANIAKEITVNFNRNGHEGAAVGATKYFFNPAVQGSDQIYRNFFGRNARSAELDVYGKEQSWAQRRSPQLKVAGALSLLGSMQTMWNLAMSGEDETGVKEYDLVKNWELVSRATFMDPDGTDGKRLGFKLPYGYGLPYVAGAIMTEMAMGERSEIGAALALYEAAEHHLAPVYIGGDADVTSGVVEGADLPSPVTRLVNVAAPDYTKPVLDVYANRRNMDGKPVFYDDPSKADAYEAVRAPEWYQAPFQFLSDGMSKEGSEHIAGDAYGMDLSFNPDISWYLVESYLGANVRLINQTSDVYQEIQMENLTPDVVEGYVKTTDLPFINKFIRETPKQEIIGRFFEYRTRMDPYKSEFQDYINADLHYGKSQTYRESRMAELSPEDREFRYLAWLSTTDLQRKLTPVMYGEGLGTLEDVYIKEQRDLVQKGLETDEDKMRYKELRDNLDNLEDTRIALMTMFLKFAYLVSPPRVKE